MKTFVCRFGCGHSVEGAPSKLVGHYKTEHPNDYEAMRAAAAARRAENAAEVPVEEEPASESGDPETELLFAASALFAEQYDEIGDVGCGRVLSYLYARFAPPDESTVPVEVAA